jgi:hypothetical protein
MKKILLGVVAVAFVALMITNANCCCVPPQCNRCHIPPPPNCNCRCPGFRPGFWKHNIKVRLGLAKGGYSTFKGGPLNGVKLNDSMMDCYLCDIRCALNDSSFSYKQALTYLSGKCGSTDRTNMANWFNWFAGYGWYKN